MHSAHTTAFKRELATATPMAFARAVVQAYEKHGKKAHNALQLAQIAPAELNKPTAYITAHQLEVLSGSAMKALDDEALGAFSRRLPWGSYGMLARASLSSPNLGIALRRWCRHHALLTDDIVLSITQAGNSARLDITEKTPGAVGEFGLVHVMRNIHGLACWYIDSRIALQGARLAFSRPAHAQAYALMFPCALQFDAAKAGLDFDARYLAQPMRRDETALQHMLQRALPLTVLQYRRDRLLVGQLRQALASSTLQACNAQALAKSLNMSARTLHRQLHEEGASLQQLKDEVRSAKAKELLLRTTMPIKKVAEASGFTNDKSFIRAFRQWTHTSPAAFRALQAQSPALPA